MPAFSLPADIAADLLEVDRTISQRLRSEVELVNTIGSYIIGSGGKRLRPILVLLFARGLGYGESQPGESHHVLLATVIEFIHTATLLHDDVVDESELRRGMERRELLKRFGSIPLAASFALSPGRLQAAA